VAEYFFELSPGDQREALEQVRAATGRPTHLLEKDVWVVWTLRALFESPLAADLTLKGGASRSGLLACAALNAMRKPVQLSRVHNRR
jgi:hypothetical protein